jgi:hypothetical protein
METQSKKMKLTEYSSFDIYIQNYKVPSYLKLILEQLYNDDQNLKTLYLYGKFQEILTL